MQNNYVVFFKPFARVMLNTLEHKKHVHKGLQWVLFMPTHEDAFQLHEVQVNRPARPDRQSGIGLK